MFNYSIRPFGHNDSVYCHGAFRLRTVACQSGAEGNCLSNKHINRPGKHVSSAAAAGCRGFLLNAITSLIPPPPHCLFVLQHCYITLQVGSAQRKLHILQRSSCSTFCPQALQTLLNDSTSTHTPVDPLSLSLYR